MTHRNARLTPVTRAELTGEVERGWTQAEVARQFRVSRATVAKWVGRRRRAKDLVAAAPVGGAAAGPRDASLRSA